MLPNIGEARLIPLNKVWPNIPSPDEFRPITVLSPIFKWMELRFIGTLNTYQKTRMKREQIGFVPEMSTLTNIRRLIYYMQAYKAVNRKILIFIDFKCAFNSINRNKLYDILLTKKVLPPDEYCPHTPKYVEHCQIRGGEEQRSRDPREKVPFEFVSTTPACRCNPAQKLTRPGPLSQPG